jgi:Protein of unknown function (DUF3253)
VNETRIREEIRARVQARSGSICPSEVARALDEDWRALMPRVREQAGALLDAGELRVTQKDRDVDPRTARGPIRLRRAPAPPA